MESAKLSRRWLMRLIPATALALSTVGATQAGGLTPARGAKTSYSVALISLIPHAPKYKREATLDIKAGERVSVRQYLNLPLVLEIEPHPLTHPVLDGQGRKITDFYTVRLLDERGREIREMNIGTATTAMFVDQRLAIFLSEAT